MRFTATVELGGKSATGIQVPDEVVTALGAGKRPPVRVTAAGHTYPTTIASMSGRFLVPLNAENRAAAGVAAGDVVDVEVELDAAPRALLVPADLADALDSDAPAREFFDGLAHTHRKEWVRWIEAAKRAKTRSTRIARTLQAMQAGERTR